MQLWQKRSLSTLDLLQAGSFNFYILYFLRFKAELNELNEANIYVCHSKIFGLIHYIQNYSGSIQRFALNTGGAGSKALWLRTLGFACWVLSWEGSSSALQVFNCPDPFRHSPELHPDAALLKLDNRLILDDRLGLDNRFGVDSFFAFTSLALVLN